MDATIYQLDNIRSQRAIRTHIDRIFPAPSIWAGSAPPATAMLLSATSFWVEYWGAMASFHVRLMSDACSPC